MEIKAKLCIVRHNADLLIFLFDCARKSAFCGINITARWYCITVVTPAESCAGPFVGFVQKYQFWGEIFASLSNEHANLDICNYTM